MKKKTKPKIKKLKINIVSIINIKMGLYQVYCESNNNQAIFAIYQASNDQKARDKIKLHIRDNVVKHPQK